MCVCVHARMYLHALYRCVSWENKILVTLLKSPSRKVLLETFLPQITPNRSLSRTTYSVREPGWNFTHQQRFQKTTNTKW